jgi:hypothetical protein
MPASQSSSFSSNLSNVNSKNSKKSESEEQFEPGKKSSQNTSSFLEKLKQQTKPLSYEKDEVDRLLKQKPKKMTSKSDPFDKKLSLLDEKSAALLAGVKNEEFEAAKADTDLRANYEQLTNTEKNTEKVAYKEDVPGEATSNFAAKEKACGKKAACCEKMVEIEKERQDILKKEIKTLEAALATAGKGKSGTSKGKKNYHKTQADPQTGEGETKNRIEKCKKDLATSQTKSEELSKEAKLARKEGNEACKNRKQISKLIPSSKLEEISEFMLYSSIGNFLTCVLSPIFVPIVIVAAVYHETHQNSNQNSKVDECAKLLEKYFDE